MPSNLERPGMYAPIHLYVPVSGETEGGFTLSPKSRIPADTKCIKINFGDQFITILSQKGNIFLRLHNPTCHISWWTLRINCSCLRNLLSTKGLQFCSLHEAGHVLDYLKYFNSCSNRSMLWHRGRDI